jgi:hypothetical protein
MQYVDVESCTQINYNNVDLMNASTPNFYRTSYLDMDHIEEKYLHNYELILNKSMKSVPIWTYGLTM